jgi:hypothetical protein
MDETIKHLRDTLNELLTQRDRLESAIAATRVALGALNGTGSVATVAATAVGENSPAVSAPVSTAVIEAAAATAPANRSAKSSRLEDRILKIFGDTQETTLSQIRLETGARPNRIAMILRSLESRGIIRRTTRRGPRVAGRGKAPIVWALASTLEMPAAG